MWELTSEERHQLAKGGKHLDQKLQTKKQLFSIYKEESVLRKKFEEVLSCYDEDDAHRNASGVNQRMGQALAERRRYFSVNAVSTPSGKWLSLPNVLSSPRSFKKPVLKPKEKVLSDEEKFGHFPALSVKQQNNINKSTSFKMTDVQVNKGEFSVKSEKAPSNDISSSLESPRPLPVQKPGPLQKDRFDPIESPGIKSLQKKRSLSFPSSSTIRPVVRGTRGERIGFVSSWKTRLHRRPYVPRHSLI